MNNSYLAVLAYSGGIGKVACIREQQKKVWIHVSCSSLPLTWTL